MSKTLLRGTVCLALLAGFVISGCGPGEEQAQAGPQTTCPMMDGNRIDKKVHVDHNGKRVYFCCGECIKDFNADPEKNIKEMTDAGVILEEIPEENSGP